MSKEYQKHYKLKTAISGVLNPNYIVKTYEKSKHISKRSGSFFIEKINKKVPN